MSGYKAKKESLSSLRDAIKNCKSLLEFKLDVDFKMPDSKEASILWKGLQFNPNLISLEVNSIEDYLLSSLTKSLNNCNCLESLNLVIVNDHKKDLTKVFCDILSKNKHSLKKIKFHFVPILYDNAGCDLLSTIKKC